MDRRRHRRFTKRLEVIFSSGSTSFSGVSSNLSESGLFIRTKRGFTPGSIINIELAMPDGRVSFLKCLVKRTVKSPLSVKNGMGVELIEKDATYINFLRSFSGEAETREKEVSEGLRLDIEDAEQYISQGRYANAIDVYRRLLLIEPGNVFVSQRMEELRALLNLLGDDNRELIARLNSFLEGVEKRR